MVGFPVGAAQGKLDRGLMGALPLIIQNDFSCLIVNGCLYLFGPSLNLFFILLFNI